jgi:hypothetical protein
MIKHVFPILFGIVFNNAAYAQPDTLAAWKGKDTAEKYDTVYKLFLKEKEQAVRHLWKINLTDLTILTPNLGFEQRMGKNWSSESYLKFGAIALDDCRGLLSHWEANQQLKFYYNLNRRERHGKNTNGFSGNYLSLDFYAGEQRHPKPGFGNTTLVDAVSCFGTGLHYGLQRKIGNIGYLELLGGIHYQVQWLAEYTGRMPLFEFSNPGSTVYRKWQWVLGVKAGIALGSISKTTGIFHSHFSPDEKGDPSRMNLPDEESLEVKRLWKWNLVGYALFKPNVGFEFKIARKWSSDTYIQVGIDEGPPRNTSFSVFDIDGRPSLEIGIEQQLKHYFNAGRREQKHTRHGFTGGYLSCSLFAGNKGYYYDYESPEFGSVMDVYARYTVYGAGLKYGLQRRIGGIGYFDVFAGADCRFREVPEEIVRVEKGGGYFEYRMRKTTRQEFIPVVGLRAGFALDSHSKRRGILK